MRFIFLSILSLTWSGISLADYRKIKLEKEIHSFISILNSQFEMNVKAKIRSTCGFSATTDSSGSPLISYCKKDIQFFEKLRQNERPLDSLLTVIAHEYSHFLLDYDMSEEGNVLFEKSIRESADFILHTISNDPKKLAQVKKFQAEQSDGGEMSISDAIFEILLIGDHHENTDSLGVKIMIMSGYFPNQNVVKYLPLLTGSSGPNVNLMVEGRIKAMTKSMTESAAYWSNFICIGNGRNLNGSNVHLKRFLSRNNYLNILNTLNNECTRDQTLSAFNFILDRYIP